MYNPTPNLPAGQLYNNGAVRFDTRQAANMLYQEQRMRQSQQAQQSQAIQKMMQEEMGKVRSADTQAISEAYNKYARLGEMLYNKKINNDPAKRNEIQMQKERAYSELMGGINSSKQLKEREKMLDQAYMTNPDVYADDYSAMRAAMNKTSVGNIGKVMHNGKMIDLSSDEPLRFNGSNYNLAEVEQKAEGQLRNTGFKDKKALDAKGLQFEETPYQFGNNPQAYKDYYMSALHERKAGRAASAAWDNLPQDEIQKTIQEFKSIAPDKWKKMGIDAQDLNSSNPDNKAENWATYRAMRYAIDKNPVAAAAVRYTDKNKEMELDEAKDRRMAQFNHGLRESEIKLHDQLKHADKKTQDASIDTWMKGVEQEAFASQKGYVIERPNGTKVQTWQVPLTAGLRKSFERTNEFGKKQEPDILGVDQKGYYYPIFYKKNIKDGKYVGDGIERKNGKPVIDDRLSTRAHRDAVKLDIANTYTSPKFVEGNLDDDTPASDLGPSSPQQPANIDANYFLNLK